MDLLKERIRLDGKVLNNDILKVDSFITKSGSTTF